MMPDYPLGETLDFKFTTRAFATGIPTTLAGSPVVDIYEDNSLTQITTAETLTVDFDSITGLNNLRVVATSGNGFESGKSYSAVLSAGTVDSVSVVGEVVAQFSIDRAPVLISATASAALEDQYDGTGLIGETYPATQAQIGNIASGTAAINVTAESTEATTPAVVGTPTNTYTSTVELDGTYHSWVPAGGELEFAYNFDVGASGIPVSVTWDGYCQSINDTVTVYARNWAGASWQQVGTISGTVAATEQLISFDLTTAHVGTGADIGSVRIRFVSTGGSIITAFATDRILCSYAVVDTGLGFVGGAVWVDTVGGEAGTAEGIGQITRPVDNIADAKTIADANNLKLFHCLPGTSITLAASYDGYEFIGASYTVALGGQSLSGTHFTGATITGNDDGSNGTATEYHDCNMGSSTLGKHRLLHCQLSGDVVLAEAADYFWEACYSGVAGTGTPSVDFEAVAETKNLSIRHLSGGMEFKNFGNTGTHAASVEGFGQIVLNASCAGGTIAVRGTFTVTDNAGGAVTLSDDARIDVAQINAQADTALTDYNLKALLPAALVSGRMDSDVGAIQTAVSNAIADALLDRSAAIDALTPRETLAIMLAGLAGEVSGAATTTVTLKNHDGTDTRIVATVDADGNRSAVALTTTGIT